MTRIMFLPEHIAQLCSKRKQMMKKILLINDGSTAVSTAAKTALHIARDMHAEILIVQTYHAHKASAPKVLADALKSSALSNSESDNDGLYRRLQQLKEVGDGFQPSISLTRLAAAEPNALAELARQAECWLIVSGCGQLPAGTAPIDFQSLLNRLRCPLLLVPESWTGDPIRRITYMADLRYCRLNIMRYLADWVVASNASLSLAHLSAKGLAPIVESYGIELFEAIARQLPACELTFNNIREPDINRALDVLIHALHTDLLVLINHRYHFSEIIGDRLTGKLPEGITIPALLFPI